MLEKVFAPIGDYALFVLRLFVSAIFVTYGARKLFWGLEGFAEYLEKINVPLPEVIAPAVAAIEFFGGLAILLGTSTRLAALLLTAVMIVAMITVTIPKGFAGGYDLNLALLGGLLALLMAGPGKPSVGGDL